MKKFLVGVIGIRLSQEGDLCDYELYQYGEYSLDVVKSEPTWKPKR